MVRRKHDIPVKLSTEDVVILWKGKPRYTVRTERSYSEVLKAWQVALDVYKQSFEQKPSSQVRSILGQSKLMSLIKDAQEKKVIYDASKLRGRVFQNVKSVLRFVSRYTSIVDGLCSVHPMPTALIWGGIKFLLKVMED